MSWFHKVQNTNEYVGVYIYLDLPVVAVFPPFEQELPSKFCRHFWKPAGVSGPAPYLHASMPAKGPTSPDFGATLHWSLSATKQG